MSTRRGVFAWMLFDWANQPFQTLIVTFIFAPWFVAEVIGLIETRPDAQIVADVQAAIDFLAADPAVA